MIFSFLSVSKYVTIREIICVPSASDTRRALTNVHSQLSANSDTAGFREYMKIQWRISIMRLEMDNGEQKKKRTADPADAFIPPKDERRTIGTEFKKMKEMGFKDGSRYFWDYYHWPVIVTVIVILCSISLITTVIKNKRPYVIEVMMYNNYVSEDADTDAFCEEFADHMGENLTDSQMLFSASDYFDPETSSEEMMATLMKFSAMIAASELDLIGGDRKFIDYYSFGTEDDVYFYDLKEVLPADMYQQLEDDGLLYYSEYRDENGNTTGKYASAVDMSKSRLTDEGGLLITPCYLGIACNTSRLDTAIEFLRWALYID